MTDQSPRDIYAKTALSSVSTSTSYWPSSASSTQRKGEAVEATETGTLPVPLLADLDAERGVLGCMLGGDEWTSKAAAQLKPEHFYDPLHRLMFQVMSDSGSSDRARLLIDIKKIGSGFTSGDVVLRTNECGDFIPSPANLPHYVAPLKECERKRALCEAVVTSQSLIKNGASYAEAMIGLDKLLSECDASEGEKSTHKEQILNVIDRIEKCQTGEIGAMGVPTGIPNLDYLTNGIQPGDMFVVAARPGMGKTTLGMNISTHAALNAKKGVLFFSLEMDYARLLMRAIASVTEVDMKRMETKGALTSGEITKITRATGKINTSGLRIIDKPGMSLFEIRAICRSMCKAHKIDLVVVDYVQLVKVPGFKPSERVREIAEISLGLKALARELGVGFIVLAQLNRESVKMGGRRPIMADLAQGGSLEQDADAVALLHKPDPEDDIVTLILDKQRNGDTGMVNLLFRRSINKFEQATPFD